MEETDTHESDFVRQVQTEAEEPSGEFLKIRKSELRQLFKDVESGELTGLEAFRRIVAVLLSDQYDDFIDSIDSTSETENEGIYRIANMLTEDPDVFREEQGKYTS